MITVTPSQADKGRECIRKPAWDVVDPQPFEQGEAAALGDLIHDALESYNKAGVAPDKSTLAGSLALLALPYAPKPRTGSSEKRFVWTYAGIAISGRDDWSGRVEDLNGTCGTVGSLHANVDYKSTGDTSRGVWGTEKHYQDTQSLTYALRKMVLTGEMQCYNRWLYIRTGAKSGKPPAALPSDQLMQLDRTREGFERLVLPVMRKIVHMKTLGAQGKFTVQDVLALPPNVRQCKKFMKRDGTGGCPRRAQCNITAQQELEAAEGEDRYEMDLLAALKQEAAAGTPSVNPTPSASAPAAPPAFVVPSAPPAALFAAPAPAQAASLAQPAWFAEAAPTPAPAPAPTPTPAPAPAPASAPAPAPAPAQIREEDFDDNLHDRVYMLLNVIDRASDNSMRKRAIAALKPIALEVLSKF